MGTLCSYFSRDVLTAEFRFSNLVFLVALLEGISCARALRAPARFKMEKSEIAAEAAAEALRTPESAGVSSDFFPEPHSGTFFSEESSEKKFFSQFHFS